MKSKRFILLTFSLFTAIYSKGQPALDTIAWHDDVKLTWVDFKGTPDMSLSFDAFTRYSIQFKYNYLSNIGINIYLWSYFDRNKSWVKHGKEKDSLLIHEKAHFALAEVYARKARKALADTVVTKSNVNDILTGIYIRIMHDCDKREAQYDIETQHSKISAKQIEWLNEIYSELDELKAYSNPVVQKTFQ
jgi:hypothetical protein